jgi:peptidoglycan/LPS O-acetylase OafA/YrhL
MQSAGIGWWVIAPVLTAVTGLFALASYRYVERPLRRNGRSEAAPSGELAWVPA